MSLLLVLLAVSGCWDVNKAPAGFGVVREHVISARNDPPIRSEINFTILEIDGAPVKRESIPRYVDQPPGAIVSAGTHRFRVNSAPHAQPPGYQSHLPPGYQPHEVTFEANVESERVYYLVENKNQDPVLIEGHLDSN